MSYGTETEPDEHSISGTAMGRGAWEGEWEGQSNKETKGFLV